MEIYAVKCDGKGCIKRTFDHMSDGWLVMQGGFSKFKGRDKSGTAKIEVFYQLSTDARHFCSWACFGRSK